MLWRLSVSNIRKSLRDYAVYFFTLIIGVSVFYLFNAIESQTTYLIVSKDTRDMIKIVNRMLSGVSVFVAVVLGLLIVYASRFLMKRRNREFALYLTLGMGKGEISAILLIETVMIGAGSLIVGMLIGIGLSQVTSAMVASLFDADMTIFKFTVSKGAIIKTVIYFGIMYLVVMVFNTFMISKCRLIDLMYSGKRSEKLRLKNPVVCVIVFAVSLFILIYAYWYVGWNTDNVGERGIILAIIAGCVCTFFIFWSVSGLMLKILMSVKGLYYRGLNTFTFRQLSSKVNTVVFSMTVICLMLFVTICTLCGAFTIRNSLNSNLEKCCPADYQIYTSLIQYNEENESEEYIITDIGKLLEECGYDTDDYFEKTVEVYTYEDKSYDIEAFFGEYLSELTDRYLYDSTESKEIIMTLGDYNRLRELYGFDKLTMADDEYIELCNVKDIRNERNIPLENGHEITVFGHKLKPHSGECIDTCVMLSNVPQEIGVTIIPDSAADESCISASCFTANFNTQDKQKISGYLEEIGWDNIYNKLREKNNTAFSDDGNYGVSLSLRSKYSLAQENIGVKAMVTFLGLYLGIVFLITSGAILALRSLSDSADSIGRYEMLRKLGTEEREINASLFRQTGLFFLLPLVLAVIHSVFGMKFAYYFLNILGTTDIVLSMTMTGAIILLIFGGYFVITYLCSRSMIKENKE